MGVDGEVVASVEAHRKRGRQAEGRVTATRYIRSAIPTVPAQCATGADADAAIARSRPGHRCAFRLRVEREAVDVCQCQPVYA